MNICLNASEIASMIGKNKFTQPSEVVVRIWKKYFYTDYCDIIDELSNKSIKVVARETDAEIVHRITKETNVDIKKEMSECLKTGNVVDLQKKKKEILKKLPKEMPTEKKAEFKKSLEGMANTNFGTRNENSILEKYIVKTKRPAITCDHFFRKKVLSINFEDGVIDWYIIGKVDALVLSKDNPAENTIIEIKNRIYKFFYHLREYEKIQTYCYMFILGYNNAQLVEALKNKEGGINIIDVKFDSDYWGMVNDEIEQFITFFLYEFMENRNVRELLITNEKEFNEITWGTSA
jgi:hypothetical protein